ncbi:hypothetical protein M407DRAFT_18175 [Tulasnella calospora MUT 4182]|uniref:Protein kinase domain-containing protein n=1 Tax=Tulasnella calospora MUT 4182 TaxID=1051891 RepID=A0A0C3LGD5_9AGAM|nr:hypothetical protein M407DRAFT_18175 [Tulasnella calospora MUT 4182]
MCENTNEEEQVGRSTIATEAVIDDVDNAMKRLRICPRTVLRSLSHLRIDKARIKPLEIEARKGGGKADVQAAILASARSSSSSESDEEEYVAVKKLRFDEDNDGDRTLAPLAHEVNLLNHLSHKNVVKIVGFVEDIGKGVAWMVFAWEKDGNLREFIRSAEWELPERVSLIHDVATGLSYLHGMNPPICHGDLKSLNILVNSENRAVITDFGSARAVDSVVEREFKNSRAANATQTPHSPAMEAQEAEVLTAEIALSRDFITITGPAWTVRWAAPELLDGYLPSLASDIWALGWICWEAVTGNFPFDKENDVAAVLRITKGDLPIVENDDQFHQIKALCSLMRECWKLATYSSEMPANRLMDVGDEGGKAKVVKAIGEVYHLRDEYSRAEESYIQARHIYSQIEDRLGFAQSVKSLGDVYRMRNEYSKAEESYTQAGDIFAQIGDQSGFAQSVSSLGDVYRMRDEYPKAEESYIQACSIYSQTGNWMGIAQSVDTVVFR